MLNPYSQNGVATTKRYKCNAKNGAQTKRPKTKRPKGQNVPRQNVPGTKRPKGQNVPRDRTSQGTERPKGTNEAHFLT